MKQETGKNDLINNSYRLVIRDNGTIYHSILAFLIIETENRIYYHIHNYWFSVSMSLMPLKHKWKCPRPVTGLNLSKGGWEFESPQRLSQRKNIIMTLNELGQKIKAYRESVEVYTPNELNGLMLAKLMRIVMECAEAGEAVREGDLENFETELADIIMLTSDICATMGIDVEAVIEQKLQAFRVAPRGKWHGKAIGI